MRRGSNRLLARPSWAAADMPPCIELFSRINCSQGRSAASGHAANWVTESSSCIWDNRSQRLLVASNAYEHIAPVTADHSPFPRSLLYPGRACRHRGGSAPVLIIVQPDRRVSILMTWPVTPRFPSVYCRFSAAYFHSLRLSGT